MNGDVKALLDAIQSVTRWTLGQHGVTWALQEERGRKRRALKEAGHVAGFAGRGLWRSEALDRVCLCHGDHVFWEGFFILYVWKQYYVCLGIVKELLVLLLTPEVVPLACRPVR